MSNEKIVQWFGIPFSHFDRKLIVAGVIGATVALKLTLSQLINAYKIYRGEPHGLNLYLTNHSDPEPDLLRELRLETGSATHKTFMVSGGVQGRFLKMLVQITGAKNILEIGCFTGYSALCLAEGLPQGGHITTLDISPEYTSIAKKYWARAGPPAATSIDLKLGPALDSIRKLEGPFDFVYIDADKQNYINYYEAVLPLVKPGGIIAVDNVFLGGFALSWFGRLIWKEANAISQFNAYLAKDSRVEKVMLPIRDGLTLIRKKHLY